MSQNEESVNRITEWPFKEGIRPAIEYSLEAARHIHHWLSEHRPEQGEKIVRQRQTMIRLLHSFEDQHALLGAVEREQIMINPRPLHYGALQIPAFLEEAYENGIDIVPQEEEEERRQEAEERKEEEENEDVDMDSVEVMEREVQQEEEEKQVVEPKKETEEEKAERVSLFVYTCIIYPYIARDGQAQYRNTCPFN